MSTSYQPTQMDVTTDLAQSIEQASQLMQRGTESLNLVIREINMSGPKYH
jgi:hypothetical protein